MNKLKLIVALVAGLFAFTSVNAGEISSWFYARYVSVS